MVYKGSSECFITWVLNTLRAKFPSLAEDDLVLKAFDYMLGFVALESIMHCNDRAIRYNTPAKVNEIP